MLSCVQDGGKARYEPAAQSCMQRLGAPRRVEPQDVDFSFVISDLNIYLQSEPYKNAFYQMEFISEFPYKLCYRKPEVNT
jgi:hypothetical protein